MMPLWSSYLVKVYAWKLILAKEGIADLARQAACICPGCSTAARRAGDRRPVAVLQLYRHVPGLRLHLDAVHDPADPGGAGARAASTDRGVRPISAPSRADLPDT